jgi:tetratricopeptide (TPR) repeat protein
MTESRAKQAEPKPEKDLLVARPTAAERPAPLAPPVPVISVTPSPHRGKGLLGKLNPLKLFQRESPSSLVNAARQLASNRNFAQATVAFNRALALDPNHVPAYEGLGEVLLKKGGRANVEAAVLQYQEIVKRDPFNDRAYAALGRAFDALGKRKEAALEKKKLVVARTLRADPNNPIANNNMGIMLLQVNQIDAAIEYFARSAQANPRYDTAVRNLAVVHYKLASETTEPALRAQSLEKANDYITKALEIAESPLTLLAQARVFLLEERSEEALAVCDRVEQIDPAMKEMFGLKKAALLKLNRLDEANKAHETWRFLNAHG